MSKFRDNLDTMSNFLAIISKFRVTELKQGIASDTIPSHCTTLLTDLIAGCILIC